MSSRKRDNLQNRIADIASGLESELAGIRHSLHSMPEIMFKEYKTSAFIRECLSGLNVTLSEPYIGTDVSGVIKGRTPGRTVLLRADIDALNLCEKTGVSWQSGNKGLAHSCGHDGHTAMLLGAVKILSTLTDYFSGNVKFVFQPAEEEGGGGKILVEKGLLDDEPAVDEVYALHGWPGVKEGCFESAPGAMMAAVDNFNIEIKGKGGHAAMPQLSVDPVVTSAQVITALQSVVSRNTDPSETAVLSVCAINGGELNNVIPDSVTMKGTVRYFRKEMRDFFRSRIERVLKGICGANMADYNLDYRPSYIPLVNNPGKVAFIGEVLKGVFGNGSWIDSAKPTTGGEDFAYYLDKRPGAFYRLGIGLEHASLHSSSFDFNDRALKNGVISFCAISLSALGCDLSADF